MPPWHSENATMQTPPRATILTKLVAAMGRPLESSVYPSSKTVITSAIEDPPTTSSTYETTISQIRNSIIMPYIVGVEVHPAKT